MLASLSENLADRRHHPGARQDSTSQIIARICRAWRGGSARTTPSVTRGTVGPVRSGESKSLARTDRAGSPPEGSTHSARVTTPDGPGVRAGLRVRNRYQNYVSLCGNLQFTCLLTRKMACAKLCATLQGNPSHIPNELFSTAALPACMRAPDGLYGASSSASRAHPALPHAAGSDSARKPVKRQAK